MNILHGLTLSLPNQTGYSIRSKYILEGQRKIGLNSMAVTPPLFKSVKREEIIEDIKYFRTLRKASILFEVPFIKHIVNMKQYQQRIECIVKNEKIEILHAHSPYLTSKPMLEVAKKYNIPFVYEVRGFWEESAITNGKFSNNSYRYKHYINEENDVIKNADAVIAISNGIKTNIMARNLSQDNIHVIPNGVDINKFQHLEKEEKLINLKNKYNIKDEIVIGYISYFRKMEGIEYIIKAFDYLKDVNMKAILVGDGPEFGNLKDLVNHRKLTDKVIFTGRVPHNEVKDYYNLIDIFIIPRINEKVTNLVTPLKPLEAMAMKKTVVASDVGGLSELIQDDDTGLLFKSEDERDLAKKVRALIQNERKRSKLSENAYSWVVNERQWDNLIPMYKNFYEGLVSE